VLKPGEMMRQLNQMTFSVLLTGHVKCTPGWKKGPRLHQFNTLWLVAKGKGTFHIDGAAYPAEPGKLFFIAPRMTTDRQSDDNDPLEYYFVRFAYATAAYEENNHWHFADDRETPFPLRGAYTIQNPPPLLNLCEQIDQLMKRRGQVVTMRRRILFLEILIGIINDFRAQQVAGNTTMAIERTIDYMVNHYREHITLEQLAEIAGLSPSHYSRLFKKYAGHSPIDYLLHLRMDRAKELLVLSDYRLKAIAESIGYTDELYFSRMFKKIVGLSPTEFAKKYRANPQH
jgi:AraC-like DNA-binding protein/mannose-6-phosphate isomerase-like protein (cupin superfamily)